MKNEEYPRVLVFNSGSGSGFEKLVEAMHAGVLQAKSIVLVTNNLKYGCVERAKRLGIKYILMTSFGAEDYQKIVQDEHANYVLLSGWLKLVKGLNPCTTINIHPGSLPLFGGPGMYGHHVHKATIAAYKRGKITHTEICMHFVPDPKSEQDYDKGLVFFRFRIPIDANDTAESLATRVNLFEHAWQSYVSKLVITGQISWDGKNIFSLVVPNHMKCYV
ncbi:MAG: formyltransferase family protein [bacterium]